MLHEDRRRAESFGADAERYDRSRPTYPPELIEDLLAASPGRQVLDVGCGTGIAARLLADRGADVLGVEVDGRMAALARAKGVPVEIAAFESWAPAGRSFDLITAGQAWHWVDPVGGAAKAASLLTPGGVLAPFWNVGAHPAELRRRLDDVYARLAPEADGQSVLLGYSHRGEYEPQLAGMRQVPDLEEPEVRRYRWSVRYGRDEWLDQLPTHSDHATMPAAARERLLAAVGAAIDDYGGSFEMSYVTVLLMARRR